MSIPIPGSWIKKPIKKALSPEEQSLLLESIEKRLDKKVESKRTNRRPVKKSPKKMETKPEVKIEQAVEAPKVVSAKPEKQNLDTKPIYIRPDHLTYNPFRENEALRKLVEEKN